MTIPSAFWSEREEENDTTPPAVPDELERSAVIEKNHPESEHNAKTGKISRKGSQNSTGTASTEEESIKEIDVYVDDTTTVLGSVAGVNKMAKSPSDLRIGEVLAPGASSRISYLWGDAGAERGNAARQQRSNWTLKFQRYRRKIIALWDRLKVPLVHRSYFFLLFKGDPSDNVYLEVELRRLYFLKDTSARRTNSIIDTQIVSPGSSSKSLMREREYLARQLHKKFTKGEKEELYLRWGIDLETKQRSLQLTRSLWTDMKHMKHMLESSVLVTKLVGLVEPRYAPKEMFGLCFLTPSSSQKSSSWRDNMSSLL